MANKNAVIRWKKEDKINLEKAINSFNRKITKLNREEKLPYLPKKVDYFEAKHDIYTRSELNRYIESLNKFKAKGAEDIYKTEAGEIMTQWERANLEDLSKRGLKVLDKRISKENIQASMMNSEELALNKSLVKNFQSLEKLTGQELKNLKERLNRYGASDYDFKEAKRYQQFYYDHVLPNFENFDNYELLKKKLDRIKNPIKFYDTIQQSDFLNDVELWYPKSLEISGLSPEQAFNAGLVQIGFIKSEEITEE